MLWRLSPSELVQDYRLLTATYGLKPSPYLTIDVILQLVKD